MIDRDRSIASQNAANVAGQIVAAMIGPASDVDETIALFKRLRSIIFEGTLAMSDVPGAPGAGTPSPAPSPGSRHSCAHGDRVYRKGTSAKGPWAGWFCPLPKERKDEQCAPEFV